MARYFVEIVGAAGAGKTTLLSALQASAQPIEAVYSFRKPEHAPSFAVSVIGALPALVTQRLRGYGYSQKAMLWMIRLKAAHQILRRQRRQAGQNTIVLDQGPVYMLTRLMEYGATQGADVYLDRWWQQALAEWANLLDLVILLDAPEAVLVERVFGRGKTHFAKGKPEAEAKAILARHRKLYGEVVAQLTHKGKTRLLHFDTSVCSVEWLQSETVAALTPSTYHDYGKKFEETT